MQKIRRNGRHQTHLFKTNLTSSNKDLPRKTATEKVPRDKTLTVASKLEYDGH